MYQDVGVDQEVGNLI